MSAQRIRFQLRRRSESDYCKPESSLRHEHSQCRLAIIIDCDNNPKWILTVREFIDDGGRSPFREWLLNLDQAVEARIQARVLRFELGNLGDHKKVGGGVREARLAFGPGYRMDFGRSGRELILLLIGGDKSSQRKDVHRAKEYWATYLKETQHGSKK